MIPLRTAAAAAAAQARDMAARTTGIAVGGTPSLHILGRYLDWVDQAEILLGNHLTPDYVEDLVRTRHYWSLRTATEDDPRLVGEIVAELRRRERALEEMARELDAIHQRWALGVAPAAVAVVDTTMFLRRTPFEDVDLTAELGVASVRAVVPIVVVHELDHRKRQNNTRDAARAALRWLHHTLPRNPEEQAQWKPGVTIEVLVHDGPFQPDPDLLIIDVSGWIARVGNAPVRLVTHDLSMRIRAHAAGVEAAYLSTDAPAGPAADA